MLRFVWDSRWKQIQVRLMGQVQLEVLKRVIAQRFDLEVDFGPGRVLYRETIADTVEGIGPCATMPRSISCWSRAPEAAGCSWPPPAPPTSWT